MRRWTMLAVASLASLWLATGMAYAEEWKGKSETKKLGNLQVEFITQADGSRVGDNNFAVQLKDLSTGQPVLREPVRVELTMDENDKSMKHGDMSKEKPVVAELNAVKDAPGRYSGKANLSSAGDWKAEVFVDPAGGRTVTFKVRVDSPGPNWLVIGGFLALIAVAAGIVVAVKRKAPSAAAVPAPEATKT